MASKAVLTYFNGRGRAEIVRLTMAATGVEFESKFLESNQEFEDLKTQGKLLFGQVPLIEFEGHNLIQSGSSARFFAKRGNLLGDNESEAVKIDMLFEGARDFINAFMAYGFAGWDDYLAKAKKTAVPKYLPLFEKVLKDNGSNGYLVGKKLSLADLALLEDILLVEEFYGMSELEAYPELKKFLETMKSINSIANYLNGPQRTKKNDEVYVANVKKVLKF